MGGETASGRWAELRNEDASEASKDERGVRMRSRVQERECRWGIQGGQEEEEGAKDAGRRSTRCVREDVGLCASTSLSLCDLFYPPSACWTKEERRLMNNRGEGEMDENEAAFLSSSSSPTFTAPLFLFFFLAGLFFFFSPFSFWTLGPKKIL